LHFAGRGCLRVGVGARAARRHSVRAKHSFARKCGPKLEFGTEAVWENSEALILIAASKLMTARLAK
jgi:hypothetical protein